MLTGAAAVAEAERRIAGRVDHRVGNAVDLAIDGTKCRVGHFYIATVFDRKGFFVERTSCQTDFSDPGLIVGRTGWCRLVAIRIEFVRVAPVPAVHACRQVGGGNAAELGAEQMARPLESREAPGVGIDSPEQLHYEPVEGRERT